MIDKLKICSSIYDVKLINNVQKKQGEVFGDVDWDTLTIRIGSKFPKQRQLQTILHEGTHIIEHEYQIKFEDENVVERLSNAIYALIIDNKEFIKEIVG